MANKHNAVVNQHRANALNTFKTFVKSAGDDIHTKNTVLLQASAAIYGSQMSGYLNRESDRQIVINPLETVRNIVNDTKN